MVPIAMQTHGATGVNLTRGEGANARTNIETGVPKQAQKFSTST